MIERLTSNGDINYWDSEIEKAAKEGMKCIRVNILLQRGENRLKILKFNLPSILFEGKNRELCIRYLTASIYNEVVCEGAANIVIFMDDKDEELHLSTVIGEELKRKYERMNIYGNFGDDIKVVNSSTLNYSFVKELQQHPVLLPEHEKQSCCIGVDVGGTNIKTVLMKDGVIEYKATEPVKREGGGELLQKQIMIEVMKADFKAKERNYDIECLGLTFPAPIKRGKNGSFKIIRLTNYERYWKEARKGSIDFKKDYDALNSIVDDVRKQGIKHIEVINDADAFGFNEIFHRRFHEENKGAEADKMGTKVVMPIGTGPGYVKIKDGFIENIPNQGGHIVIDLSENASQDPGCGVIGCYGGYVPASAMELRAKEFNIGVSGKDGFIPTDFDGALRLMGDIAKRIAVAAVKLHKITGADEVILAGGISGGEKGIELARAGNETIQEQYPEYADSVTITLSQSDINFGGAIGAARYALASKNIADETNKPEWDLQFNVPDTIVGRNIIQPFFDELNKQHEKICIITMKEVDDFLEGNPQHYPWFTALKNGEHVFHVGKDKKIDDMMCFIAKKNYDVIIPIGAGTVTDWAKYAGSMKNKKVICIPSTISGNAMFTEKAIFYRQKGESRKRDSIVSGPPAEVIFDLEFLRGMLNFKPVEGISAERANRAGAGDILSIHSALLDWDLAVKEKKEREDKVIYKAAHEILELTRQNTEFIRDNTDLGMVLLIEMLAESSLLNMRFGTSRPKDGSEHLLADQIDKSLPSDLPKLHGEQVAIASLLMGYLWYLYGGKYDERPYTQIQNMATALGLSTNPVDVGMSRQNIIQALQNVRRRKDKYTYFDKFGDKIHKRKAESVYKQVFEETMVEFTLGVCRDVNNSVRAMYEHIHDEVLPRLDSKKMKTMIDLLLETKRLNGRVIINAAGRVGEIAVFFQQKLRALGFVVDDFKEIVPEFLVNKNDLVLTFSGSGKTCSVVDNLNNVDALHRKGKLHRNVFSVTATPGANTWLIGDSYHIVMELPGRTKYETNPEVRTKGEAYLPLSSTYEYSTMLFLEGIIEALVTHKRSAVRIAEVVRKVILDTLKTIQGELTPKLMGDKELTPEFVHLLKNTMERKLDKELINRKRVYIFGLGQNNYVARLFARRIQNIGIEVYVPGPRDIISSPRRGDIAIFISNSGERRQMLRKIETAIKEGCSTVVITACSSSSLANKCSESCGIVIPISDLCTTTHTVNIMTNTDKSRKERAYKRAFELAAMFYLEGISVALMNGLHITAKDLKHVVIEWE
jgi:glycerol-1-phosphate dehydrogenase [NAD(P)+]